MKRSMFRWWMSGNSIRSSRAPRWGAGVLQRRGSADAGRPLQGEDVVRDRTTCRHTTKLWQVFISLKEIPPEELYVLSHQEELQVHQVLLHAEHLCTYLAASPFIDNVTLWIEEPSLWTQPPPPHQELFFASETLSVILVYFYTPTAKISM